MSDIAEPDELRQATSTPLPPEDTPSVSLMALEQLEMHAKEMMLWDDGTTLSIPVPTYGGIMKIPSKDGKTDDIFAWSGTDPDSDIMTYSWDQVLNRWTIPKDKYVEGAARIQGPTRNLMYRPRGVKNERQTMEFCTTYKGTKFNGLTPKEGKAAMPLKTYKDILRHHMIEHGMWDVFNLNDPKNVDKKWDLFVYNAMLPMTHVVKEVERLQSLKDMYVTQNLKWSGEYIRESLSVDMLEKLYQDVSMQASGPETFAALMRVIHSDSYEALENTKRTLENIKLKSYAGENVRKCNEDIARLSEQLVSGGHFNNELLCKIAQIYEGAADTKFSQWATSHLYDPCVKQVKELRVVDKSALNETLWTPELLIRMSNSKYDDMVASKRYTSMVTEKVTDQPEIKTYIAAIKEAVKAELKQVSFMDKSAKGTSNKTSGGSSGSFKGKCFSCNKEGHRASECPDKDSKTVPENVTINGKSYVFTDEKWKTIKPTNGVKSFKHGTLTWRYCSKCGKWGRHDDDHHDIAARSAKKKLTTESSSSSAASNIAAVESDENDDDFISFGRVQCIR